MDENQLGDAPITPEFVMLMNKLASFLDQALNQSGDQVNGFVLLTFPFSAKGRANYISNAVRSDVLRLLKEQVARFEAQDKEQGNGAVQ